MLPFPTSRDLPDPGIESEFPVAPALAGSFFTTAVGKPLLSGVPTYYLSSIPMENANQKHKRYHHFTATRMAIIKKTDDMEKLEPSYIADRHVK